MMGLINHEQRDTALWPARFALDAGASSWQRDAPHGTGSIFHRVVKDIQTSEQLRTCGGLWHALADPTAKEEAQRCAPAGEDDARIIG